MNSLQTSARSGCTIWWCDYCGGEFSGLTIARVRGHLAGQSLLTTACGISCCDAVPAKLAELFATLLRNKQAEKDNKSKQQRSRNMAASALVAYSVGWKGNPVDVGVDVDRHQSGRRHGRRRRPRRRGCSNVLDKESAKSTTAAVGGSLASTAAVPATLAGDREYKSLLLGEPSRDLPAPTDEIFVSFLTRISTVSIPIWTIDSSNDSHGPWLFSTLSIVAARDRLNQY